MKQSIVKLLKVAFTNILISISMMNIYNITTTKNEILKLEDLSSRELYY